MADQTRHPSSYRDPAGFIFTRAGQIYRQVNQSYAADYEHLMNSGLYAALIEKQLLIPHREVSLATNTSKNAYKILEPERVPFISYAYEWSFSMWKDAALLVLQLMRKAIAHGMILKDATPFNVQLVNGRMTWIDTLSFITYDATKPWIAYRQFTETFMGPLALMHFTRQPLQPLLLAYPEGIPVTLAKALLPSRSRWHLPTYLAVHLQAKVAVRKKNPKEKNIAFSQSKLQTLLKGLEAAIVSYQLNYTATWSTYYQEAAQRGNYVAEKKALLVEWIKELHIHTVLDAGANDGSFTQLFTDRGCFVISADGDSGAIESLYKQVKAKRLSIQPLLIDLANPSPAIGVNNIERESLIERIQTDLVVALAVIHHLAIGRSIPFEAIALFFRACGQQLIIEFVPKSDEKVQQLLVHKEMPFEDYTEAHFLAAFSTYFTVDKRKPIGDSGRTLYLMSSNHE